LQTYADKYKFFPPAYIADAEGRPMHSWRILILPWVSAPALYDRYDFNEPWDGPNNRLLADQMPPVYRCLSDNLARPGETSYAAVIGPETIWPGSQTLPLSAVRDGLSQTILLVEAAGDGIHWMEPRDVPFHAARQGPGKVPELGIASAHPGCANISFADASARAISNDIAPRTLKALLTRAGDDVDDAIAIDY
jgi:hypothetical protein